MKTCRGSIPPLRWANRQRNKTKQNKTNAHCKNPMRTPGVEHGSQAWKACMMPLHYVRLVLAKSAALYKSTQARNSGNDRLPASAANKRRNKHQNALPSRKTRPQHKPHTNNGQRNEPTSLFQPKTETLIGIAIALVTTPSLSWLAETLR